MKKILYAYYVPTLLSFHQSPSPNVNTFDFDHIKSL